MTAKSASQQQCRSAPIDHARQYKSDEKAMFRPLSGGNDPVECVAMRPYDKLLAVGSDGIALWDVSSDSLRRSLAAPNGAPYCLSFAPAGDVLACGFAYAAGNHGNVIRLWKVSTGEAMAELTGHPGAVSSVAFSPNGAKLASAGASEQAHDSQGTTYVDHTIRIWDMPSGTRVRVLIGHTDSVREVAFSPDGQTLASCGDDGTIRLWNASSWRGTAVLSGGEGPVSAMAFSPDGRTLASGGTDQTIRLWDVESRETREKLTGHEGAVTSVAFSPNGRILASASEDQTVLLWDAPA
ncbi:MAG: WD40 repeat domain-containing protein [Sciscionella sp.]